MQSSQARACLPEQLEPKMCSPRYWIRGLVSTLESVRDVLGSTPFTSALEPRSSSQRPRPRLRPNLLMAGGSCQNRVPLYATADELTPKEAERQTDEVAGDCTQLTFFPALHESLHSEDFLELCRERQVILQELLDHEKVIRLAHHDYSLKTISQEKRGDIFLHRRKISEQNEQACS